MSERLSKLSRIHTSLGRSRTGASSPTSDSRGLTDESEGLELGIGPPTRVHVESGKGHLRHSSSPWLQMGKDGIVVTKEVTLTVTQEERIERVIGF